MAYNEELADRLREHLSPTARVTEQEMFGGISFLVNGNMCCGVLDDDLIVRIDPTLRHDALTRPGVSEFEMGGRTSKGMVRVGPAGTDEYLDLALWVRLGVNQASELPAKAVTKATSARKGDKRAPSRKAPAKKKAAPSKKTAPAKKTAPRKKNVAAPAKKKAAVKKRAAPVKAKKAAPAKKKAAVKKVTKAKKATKTRR